ncbi:MAG: 50S ribosomal protein L21 [Candidatus Limnocylindrales bacterium]|jgi:large subunit ribosomal protein L21
MYAVIETGGKQYTVELGTELEVELLDVEPGQEINLERVLLVADGEKTAVGQPLVADASVSARVLRQDRGEKTVSFKYRPKARRRVKKGHRQELTVLRITEVRLGSKSAAAEAKVVEAEADAERDKIARAAARQAAEDAALAEKLKARASAAVAAAAPGKATPAKSAPKTAPKAGVKEATPAKSAPKTAPKAGAKEATPAKSAPKTAPKAGAKDAAPKAGAKDAAPKAGATEKAPKAGAKDAAPKAKAEQADKADADAPARRSARTKKDE